MGCPRLGLAAGLTLLLARDGGALLSTPGALRFAGRAQRQMAPRPLIRSVAEAPDLAAAEQRRQQRRNQGRLNIRIDDEWYDLTNWRAAHPAGTHWLDAYNNSDATEVMYGFHSDAALGMFKRLPKSKSPPELRPPTKATYAFRELRRQLVADGWYEPHALGEAKKLAPWFATLVAGVWLARRATGFLGGLGAITLLAVSNSLSGWLAHDFVHGRSRWCSLMRPFGELVGGMSTSWWSNKHNMHHALTNEVGYDEDIALDPFIHLWEPDPNKDPHPWLRAKQHWFWPLPYSILFWYWRIDSVRYSIAAKKWGQAARLAVHWAAFLSVVPAATLFLSIWLSGLITATIVTVTHQAEEVFFGDNLRKHDFIEAQFRSTRNAKCNNPISHILWGGMQWQLEHHIFPTMPRYKYPAVAKVLEKFANEHGLDYRITGEFKIIADNVRLLERLAKAKPVSGNPDSTPLFKQV